MRDEYTGTGRRVMKPGKLSKTYFLFPSIPELTTSIVVRVNNKKRTGRILKVFYSSLTPLFLFSGYFYIKSRSGIGSKRSLTQILD